MFGQKKEKNIGGAEKWDIYNLYIPVRAVYLLQFKIDAPICIKYNMQVQTGQSVLNYACKLRVQAQYYSVLFSDGV